MLLSYKFKNFLSFKDDAEFTMLAPGNKVKNRFPDNYVKLNSGYDVLKNAVIVGENAGGKSNFVKSFYYFRDWFITNAFVHSLLTSHDFSTQTSFYFASTSSSAIIFALFGIVDGVIPKAVKMTFCVAVTA